MITPQDRAEVAVAETRRCPYSTTGRHVMRGSTCSCRWCGTTAATIVREQPDPETPQPTAAT